MDRRTVLLGGLGFAVPSTTGQIMDDARQDKINPDDNVWGDDEKLEDRWRDQVSGYIQRTKKFAEDAYVDN